MRLGGFGTGRSIRHCYTPNVSSAAGANLLPAVIRDLVACDAYQPAGHGATVRVKAPDSLQGREERFAGYVLGGVSVTGHASPDVPPNGCQMSLIEEAQSTSVARLDTADQGRVGDRLVLHAAPSGRTLTLFSLIAAESLGENRHGQEKTWTSAVGVGVYGGM